MVASVQMSLNLSQHFGKNVKCLDPQNVKNFPSLELQGQCTPSMQNRSVPGMLTGLELRKPELTRPCGMELPEQLRDFPPSPRPEQFRDFLLSEKPLDCWDLLPSQRSKMLISSKPEKITRLIRKKIRQIFLIDFKFQHIRDTRINNTLKRKS